MLDELRIRDEAIIEKYLGLPVYIGRSQAQTFVYLKDRMWKRIKGRKERSSGHPTFAMSSFDLTKTLCEEMSAMICRFSLEQQDKENKCIGLVGKNL
jgi:hypothetical protein